jgi:uncharacterized SAM-binding protein YcdF (DUF218 family)
MGVSRLNKPRRRWWRGLLWILLALFLWSGFVIGRILHVGSRENAQRSDVIIVLGAAVRSGEPSPAFAARIRHGVELWKRGVAPKLLFTGGLGHGDKLCESEVARRMAIQSGVPASAILIEKESRITWENLIEAQRVMNERGLRAAVIVSDPDHLLRASLMADDLGLAHSTSPTPYSVFQSWGTRVPFLLNEFWHCHAHQVSRWIGGRKLPKP